MDKIINVAQYVYDEYKRVTGEVIDEMKLHKLLYFAQRESLAITNTPLFEGEFEGWKYGPVCKEIRNSITPDGIIDAFEDISDESKYIINNVIQEYGSLASWKLSELSHKEHSWKNARMGLHEGENGSRKLKLEDIREDAKKVRPYDHVWDMYYDEFEDEVME
ncbi:MAG: Panacea domain-containing protein [Enterocloster sp.]